MINHLNTSQAEGNTLTLNTEKPSYVMLYRGCKNLELIINEIIIRKLQNIK